MKSVWTELLTIGLVVSLGFLAGIAFTAKAHKWRCYTEPCAFCTCQRQPVADTVPREKYDALVRDFGSAEDEVKRLLSVASQPEGAE